MIIKSNTLRDQAYQLIRDRIICQEIPFGERLSVAQLSRDFNISNSPIREAISLLEVDGLVQNTPNYGFRVIDFSSEVLTEVSQSIKVMMLGSYINALKNNQVSELTALLEERLDNQRRFIQEHPECTVSPELADIAIGFDRAFIDICNNPMLSKMFDSKFNLLAMSLLYVYADDKQNAMVNLKQHEDILLALKSGDSDAVIDSINLHYEKSDVVIE